jgi:hypothetical protein
MFISDVVAPILSAPGGVLRVPQPTDMTRTHTKPVEAELRGRPCRSIENIPASPSC